ncbi:MAG TPA: glutathione S-transferase family protein [Porticoccus sp.]|nr:glutathione S-transferase family protein [Porticoccus sp.]
MNAIEAPVIQIYGSRISYFTGKLENYFRVKGLSYQFHSIQAPQDEKRIKKNIGLYQIPAVILADGRWMTDTTKIIQWFEAQSLENSIIPRDPLQAFLCLLIEDYADEWLWRPAMHYRWHYPEGAHHLSRHIVDEHMSGIPVPAALKRWVFRLRQRRGYTTGDGITKKNVAGVEQIYLRTLQTLQAIFEHSPFIFGDRPSLADIGLSGPFFRHFALDPIPQEIMRQQAPAVYEWVARLWNTRLDLCSSDWLTAVPDDLGPLLDDIGKSYLPYMNANVEAVASGKKRFDTVVDGVDYRGARYSRYRVWCLQELRSQFSALPADTQAEAQKLLEKHGCWQPLWQQQDLPLLPDQEQGLPFKGSTKMVGVNE